MSKKLHIILGIKVLWAVWMILFCGIGLSPDEAQYWTWSQDLDWGYYSKPPGIAWQIHLGTMVFGNTPLGVRFPTVILSVVIAYAVYFLCIRGGLSSQKAFWGAILMAFSPIGVFSSFAATTDGGFILFWILACAVCMGSLRKNQLPPYLLMGVFIALGALFKWTIYVFWIYVLICALCSCRFRSKSLLWGILISLLGLFPSVFWNATHDFATFKHVLYHNIMGSQSLEKKQFFHGNFWEFFGAQVGILSPIIFVFFVLSIVFLVRHWKRLSIEWRFCGSMGALIFVAYTLFSMVSKMQANWAVFAYSTAIVFLIYFLFEKYRLRASAFLQVGIYLSIVLSCLVLLVPALQRHGVAVPWKLNAFRQSLGWEKLEYALRDLPHYDFLFSDTYQMASILSFYSPQQKRAYFFNIFSRWKNQFSYWPQMSKGETGVFVIATHQEDPKETLQRSSQAIAEKLGPYFNNVEVLKVVDLFNVDDKVVKACVFLRCEVYNGKMLPEVNSY